MLHASPLVFRNVVVALHPWPQLNCFTASFHKVRQHICVRRDKCPIGQLYLNRNMNTAWWPISNDYDIPRAFVLEAVNGKVAVVLDFKNVLLKGKVDLACFLFVLKTCCLVIGVCHFRYSFLVGKQNGGTCSLAPLFCKNQSRGKHYFFVKFTIKMVGN